MNHLPLLPILIPLFAAALALFAEHRRFGMVPQRLIAGVSLAAQVLVAVCLLRAVADGTVLVYLLGDWPARLGISLMVDRLSAMMVLVSALLAVACLSRRCRLGSARAAFPRLLPVPADGPERRVPDRRSVQPVRVLRSAADRLLWTDAQRRARRSHARRFPLRQRQHRRLDPVPGGAGPAVRAARLAQHGRDVDEDRAGAGCRSAADPGRRRPAAAGILHQGGAAADVPVAAADLHPRAGRGRGTVRDHDQGRPVRGAAGMPAAVRRVGRRAGRIRLGLAAAGRRDHPGPGLAGSDGGGQAARTGGLPGAGVGGDLVMPSRWPAKARSVPDSTTWRTAPLPAHRCS